MIWGKTDYFRKHPVRTVKLRDFEDVFPGFSAQLLTWQFFFDPHHLSFWLCLSPKMPETFRFRNSFARIWGYFEAHIFLFAGFCLLIHEFLEFLWDQCRDPMGIRDSQIALLEDRTLCCHWEASRLQAGYTNEQWKVHSPGCLATN